MVYTLNSYTLTYTAGAGGSTTGVTPQTVNYGEDGTPVTAVPDTGYHFVNWSDGCTASPRTDINVTANLTVTANFAIDTFTLTYTAGAGGTMTGATPQTVNYGEDGTAGHSSTRTPATTSSNWSDGSTANPRTDLDVTANLSVTANFAIDTFTLTYTAGTGGSITGVHPADGQLRRRRHGSHGSTGHRLPLRQLERRRRPLTHARTPTSRRT